jgi:hypothetical protein
MAGRMSTTTFRNSVTPGFRKAYFSTIKGIPKEGRQLFNILGPKPGGQAGRNFFDDFRMFSLGTFGPKGEGQPIAYDAPIEESVVRYTPYTFGLGYRITQEMQDDDLYSNMNKMNDELAWAAAHQLEVQMFRILNNAFVTTGSGTGFGATGFNTEALISTTHALGRGGSFANRASTDLDLSITSLEAAQDSFSTLVNDSNMPTPKQASVLIIPPQQRWIAKELLESELKPYTQNNEVNPLGGEGFRYMEVHYLTDSDSWFLMAPKAQHDLNVWMRAEPTYETGDDFDTGDMKAKGVFRIAAGHGDWRGIFGSLGA